MQILRGLLAMAIASCTIVTSTAVAQGRGRGSSPEPPRKAAPSVRTKYTADDRDSDARVIGSWYREHPAERANGRGRGHAIAPGYQKKLIRSAPVPVEFREYVTPAPVLLVRTLPPVRSGWEFVVIENSVLLIDRPTWMIIDIVIVL
jgi:hypothetical protein